MTYLVSRKYSVTMEQIFEQPTGKLISVVLSTRTLTKAVQPTSVKISSSVLPAECRETVYKS
jgi:hypothetical protein